MARPITLFTGQWADLPLAELAPLARKMGYDGLELACWGDHFDVAQALASPQYVRDKRALLADHGLQCFAIGNHLVGQAVCDLIDARHESILPARVWGDGDPEGVRQRAARELQDTARAAAAFGVKTVTGFTGSSIWHATYAFPPTSQAFWDAGFTDFANRFIPILQVFEERDVNFALEVHPTEIAFDIATSERAIAAVAGHRRFGFNFDPSHLGYQGVDYIRFIRTFGPRIFNAHMKDVWWGKGDGTVGTFGGHTRFGDPRRTWDFRSVGRGMIDFESLIVALNDVGYAGPLSVEWEDSRMDRVHGATESAAFCRRLDFEPAKGAFDAVFDKSRQGGMAGDAMTRRLRYAMVGGGRDAFIGAVHRNAMALDGQYDFVAGALSGSPERSRASGADLGLADDRNHGTWQDLLADERRRPAGERVDVVVIVTPNHLHHDVARAFVDAGFHVVCDKPLVHTSAQADELVDLVAARGTLFAVTYNYTGYPMVREARELVRSGAIGAVRKVVVEYHQGWLAGALESSNNKQSTWRVDPARGGPAGAMADIGSHAENLISVVTGLELESLCADLSSFGPGRLLDDDAGLLLRFVGGARGVMSASQIAAGNENDLRLRVMGERGMLDWRQEEPNVLIHAPVDGPRRTLTRNSPGLSEAARRACRLPPGHPEGFIEAFANLYLGVAADLRLREAQGRAATPEEADYPRIEAGARGVRFIQKAVASSASNVKWTAMR